MTALSAPLNTLLACRTTLERTPLALIQLAMRIAVGAVFFNSGLLKFNSWEFAIKLFEDEYKVPFIDPVWAARLAAFNELTFPVLLVLGLATGLGRPSALGLDSGVSAQPRPRRDLARCFDRAPVRCEPWSEHERRRAYGHGLATG
jgi:hypothetical protein